jgi:hypothetical protein
MAKFTGNVKLHPQGFKDKKNNKDDTQIQGISATHTKKESNLGKINCIIEKK